MLTWEKTWLGSRLWSVFFGQQNSKKWNVIQNPSDMKQIKKEAILTEAEVSGAESQFFYHPITLPSFLKCNRWYASKRTLDFMQSNGEKKKWREARSQKTKVLLPSLPTRRSVKALKQGCDQYSLIKKGVIPKLRHSNDTKCWQVRGVVNSVKYQQHVT